MAICSYYLRGICKFGDRCRDEHPRDGSRAAFGSNSNRFGVLSGVGDSYRPGQQSSGSFQGGRPSRLPLNKDEIKGDLTDQRPIYPFSCYAPTKDAARQLLEGPVEISPEELRWRYYSQRASGNENVAQQEEGQLYQEMEARVNKILNNLDAACKYVEDGADIHPNRNDIAQGKAPITSTNPGPFSQSGSQTQTPAFGQPSNAGLGQPAAPAFGQPSNPVQRASPFGQPSNPTPAFGQPAALGSAGAGAFGKPSIPGAGAFGQPSALGAGSGFGQPSALGSSSGFGQPSALGAGSAFGKPSMPGAAPAFGQPSGLAPSSALGQSSGFGKPSMPGQTPAFGQTNPLGQNTAFGKPAFGASPFGQASQPGARPSPFAQQGSQPSPFGQQQAAGNQPSPFGQQQPQANTQPSPFGQQPQAASQASPFGQQSQQPQAASQPSPFGQQPQQPQSQATPFGSTPSSQTPAFGTSGFGKPSPSPFQTQTSTQQTPAANANPFGQKPPGAAAAPSPFGQQTQSPSPFGQPRTQSIGASPFAQQTQSQAGAGSAKAPDAKDRYKEGRPEDYEGEQGKILEEIYRRVGQLGRFNADELVPLVPPKCEWIVPVA